MDWDEDFIARDIMQNFFDANRGSLAQIRVDVRGKEVRITGPTPFNLERLFYLGSEKGDDDVGQYGEGFKVAATCLLRDHAVDVVAASGRELLRMRIAQQVVRDTSIYPVEYDFYEREEEVPGTLLLLRGCSPKLAKALSRGLTHFFHLNNALLGAQLWASPGCEFSIYESTDGKGHVFYRKLKRGEMADIPLILVIDKKCEAARKKDQQRPRPQRLRRRNHAFVLQTVRPLRFQVIVARRMLGGRTSQVLLDQRASFAVGNRRRGSF